MNIIAQLNSIKTILLLSPATNEVLVATTMLTNLINNINNSTNDATYVLPIDLFEYKSILNTKLQYYIRINESYTSKATERETSKIIKETREQLNNLNK